MISNINGDFSGNYTDSGDSAEGGAIYNNENSTIDQITGNFIDNYAKSASYYAEGGAIYNNSNTTIGNITGNFVNNRSYDTGTTRGNANGGVISNHGKINNITGNFIGNYTKGYNSVMGGAIFNRTGTINDITGHFIGNYASSIHGWAAGGSIIQTVQSVISMAILLATTYLLRALAWPAGEQSQIILVHCIKIRLQSVMLLVTLLVIML